MSLFYDFDETTPLHMLKLVLYYNYYGNTVGARPFRPNACR
jgi:hypothetical protein